MTTLQNGSIIDKMNFNPWKERFNIPSIDGKDSIYFSGNSLGLQPKESISSVLSELDDWKSYAVLGHHKEKMPWFSFHEYLTKEMASIVGAKNNEIVVMNSLTVNLHLLMISFYVPAARKKSIMIEQGAFPSDIYAVKSHLKHHSLDSEKYLISIPYTDSVNRTISTDRILEYIDTYSNQIALVLLGGVNYYNGQVFDIKSITEFAHSKDVMVGYDLAHAAGNIHLELHDWNVDFASWCGYKYLNGGPGAPSGVFIHSNNIESSPNRFEGWWGHDKESRFMMDDDFVPIPTAESWQISNPPILSMASLRSSLEIFYDIGMPKILKQSKVLKEYLWNKLSSVRNIEIITPRSVSERGSQISFRITKDSKSVVIMLREENIICDYREPDIIRIAPVPLYNTIEDIDTFVDVLENIIKG